jgi:dTDP-4-amino-4,6-dideoxygalactose transaminase
LAKEHGALLIEDACHALGAESRGKRVGGIADMTVFSFHPVKHLTTGEGGMVTTNDAGWRRLCGAFAITASAAKRASGRKRDSGFTRWCCSVSTTG